MSCFIVSAENIGNQAEFIADLLNGGPSAYYISPSEALRAVLSDCKQSGLYDAHKIYRKLYIANLKAYNGRYNDNVREFEKYKPRAVPTNLKRLHKQISCYLYQCAEDPVYNTPIYEAIEDLKNRIANIIVQKSEDYDSYEWN